MCYALLQKGAEDRFLDISTSLRQNGYRKIENSGSEVIHKAMLFMKTTNGSYDYGFSVFLSNDSMDDCEAEQFFAEIDILINEMVEKHKEEWTDKPIGMGILVLVPSQSVDLKLFLEENSVQDIKKSTVSGVIVLDDGNKCLYCESERSLRKPSLQGCSERVQKGFGTYDSNLIGGVDWYGIISVGNVQYARRGDQYQFAKNLLVQTV